MQYIYIAQKVSLKPNKDPKNLLSQLFGATRFIYNFSLEKFYKSIEETGEILSSGKLKNHFLLKRSKFDFLKDLFHETTDKVFDNLSKGIRIYKEEIQKNHSYKLKFKKKYLDNSFFLYGSHVKIVEKVTSKRKFIYFDGLSEPIKIMDKLRFDAPIISVTIKKDHKKYYASILYRISKNKYEQSHKFSFLRNNKFIGIDLGINKTLTTSSGLVIDTPLFLEKAKKKQKRLSRTLSRKVCTKTEDGETIESKNYQKQVLKIAEFHNKITNKRKDYIKKLSSVLVRNFEGICMEDLDVKSLQQNKHFAKKDIDLNFYETSETIKKKMDSIEGRIFMRADRYYPSTKRCYKCGNIKDNMLLSDRVYRCENCGTIIERDFNAACNLFKYMKSIIGRGSSKLKSAEKEKISKDCINNNLRFYFVEPENVVNLTNYNNQVSNNKLITTPHI